jgi:glutamine cyclotransferase
MRKSQWILCLALALAGCGEQAAGGPDLGGAGNAPATVQKYSYKVVKTYRHDRGAFTQGLIFLGGELYESTGMNGQSSLRRVELESGKVLQRVDVPEKYFAEGLAELNGKLYQLTWQEHRAFVYDLKTFQLERELPYDGEGWGLTTDGKQLIMSDGTAEIRFMDPGDFSVKRKITVTENGHRVMFLNELEMVKGEIYANLWGENSVVRIDPKTGTVMGRIDFSGLLKLEDYAPGTDVLNGIAYDAATDRLFVTGKRWPKLFEVKLKPAK